jgi:hypothetical protein
MLGLPIALGVSFQACRKGPDRGFAVAAAILSSLEAFALLALLTTWSII